MYLYEKTRVTQLNYSLFLILLRNTFLIFFQLKHKLKFISVFSSFFDSSLRLLCKE